MVDFTVLHMTIPDSCLIPHLQIILLPNKWMRVTGTRADHMRKIHYMTKVAEVKNVTVKIRSVKNCIHG